MAHETRLDQALEDVFEEVGVVSKKLDQQRKTPEEAHAEIRLAIEAAAQEAGTDTDVILRAVEFKFAGAANLPSLVFPLLADLKVSAAKKEVIAAVDEVSNEIKVYVAWFLLFFSWDAPPRVVDGAEAMATM